MKSLAFLFLASILFFFVGLLISEGRPPSPQPTLSTANPPKFKGSANLKKRPVVQTARLEKSGLEKALTANDLCLAAQIAGGPYSKLSPPEIRGALLALKAPIPLQDLFDAAGPIFGPIDPKKRFSTEFLNFIYALRLANLYRKEGPANSEYRKAALAILKELEAANSGNGAFPYFQLALLPGLGSEPEEIFDTAERTARASYFDTMLNAQLAELEVGRWLSPTFFFVIDRVSSEVNDISYYTSFETLERLARTSESADLKDRIGKLMMQEGLKATQRYQFHGFDSLTYAYGIEYTLAQEEKSGEALSNEIAGSEWEYAPQITPNNCHREPFDSYFEKMRGRH